MNINSPLLLIECLMTIKKTLHKTSGLNSILLNAIKVFSNDLKSAQRFLRLTRRWHTYIYKEWQVGSLNILPKKGDHSNGWN